MPKLSAIDHAVLDELAEELGIVRLGGPSAIAVILPELRQLTELDSLVCACPVERTLGWSLERFDSDNLANASRFQQVATSFLGRAPRRFASFDASRPEPGQRNVVVHVEDLVPRREFELLPAYSQVLVPLRLHQTQQIRTLICEGCTLLAWFGAFNAKRATPRQIDLLIAMIPPLRRRLVIERRLAHTNLTSAALDVVLEHLGTPAYILSAGGTVVATNQLGKDLLDARRGEIGGALTAAMSNQAPKVPIELVRVRDRGISDSWLAIVRPPAADGRLARAVATAAARFNMTSRQRQVLELVIKGETNTAIATTLGISERAIEQHISGMFERVGVGSRAGLVSFVLLGRHD